MVIIIKVVPFFSLNKGTALETTGFGKFSSLKTRKSLKLAVLYLFIYLFWWGWLNEEEEEGAGVRNSTTQVTSM